MKKYTNSIVFGLVLMACIAILPSISNAQSNGGDDVSSNTPAFSDSGVTYVNNASSNTNGDDDSSNSSNSNGGDDSSKSGNTNGGDDKSNSSNSNGGDDVVTAPPATNPTTPSAPSGGGGGCISGCSSGGGSGFISSGSSVSVIAISGTPSCSYLNSYLTLGGQNNPAEVTKLQNFLKNVEKIDVDVTGIFDTKTVDAVKAFQTKYSNETLAPWGVTTPTGQVFYTTKKKINEVYCKSTIALTAGELSGIEAYKNSVKNGIVETETANPVVGSNESTPNSQTASAGSTSFAGKVWGFVKWLFGY